MRRCFKLKLLRFDGSNLARMGKNLARSLGKKTGAGVMALLLFCAAFFVGCSKAVITKTQIVEQKVPENLLILRALKKPVINDENDVLNAYSDLFIHYKECVINIEKIRNLNNKD